MVKCNICEGPTNPIAVSENMFGSGEMFIYYQCVCCGHAHLHWPPYNPEDYYPANYYSLKPTRQKFVLVKKIMAWLGIKTSPLYSQSLEAFFRLRKVPKSAFILDFGSGAGQFVEELAALGYTAVIGYDPYLTQDTERLRHTTAEIFIKDHWDVITLNHTFEHLDNPVFILQHLRGLLKYRGQLILRFPVIDSYAFKTYRHNWVQFDAPRHLNIFSRASIMAVIDKAGGYQVTELYDDSNHFQFTGSERYLNHRTLQGNTRTKRLLDMDTYKFHFKAKKLNKKGEGDQVVVVLKAV